MKTSAISSMILALAATSSVIALPITNNAQLLPRIPEDDMATPPTGGGGGDGGAGGLGSVGPEDIAEAAIRASPISGSGDEGTNTTTNDHPPPPPGPPAPLPAAGSGVGNDGLNGSPGTMGSHVAKREADLADSGPGGSGGGGGTPPAKAQPSPGIGSLAAAVYKGPPIILALAHGSPVASGGNCCSCYC
ncbi:hypothetical protein OEA41_005707 [Lepraria neglecta]|uniref:Uncharacterized protein n=1 Tax=Lepraria neglecta TaxID=209136 RepID=A0AAD9Z7J5_9LECA|nr:hypothetical protein OEA41_005707 [Lepraria neglecta]